MLSSRSVIRALQHTQRALLTHNPAYTHCRQPGVLLWSSCRVPSRTLFSSFSRQQERPPPNTQQTTQQQATTQTQTETQQQQQQTQQQAQQQQATAQPGTQQSAADPASQSAQPQSQQSAPPQSQQSAPPTPPPDPRDVELSRLKSELAALESKQKETYDRLLRTAAEMENVRTRGRTEAENARKFAATAFAKSLLEVADTLELAAKSAKDALQAVSKGNTAGATPNEYYNQVINSLLEGIDMTEKVLAKSFAAHGVSKFNSLGEKFDPNLHHGLYQIEDPSKEVGTVAQVMKEGYKIHDRILRAAQVGTVKASSQNQSQNQSATRQSSHTQESNGSSSNQSAAQQQSQ